MACGNRFIIHHIPAVAFTSLFSVPPEASEATSRGVQVIMKELFLHVYYVAALLFFIVNCVGAQSDLLPTPFLEVSSSINISATVVRLGEMVEFYCDIMGDSVFPFNTLQWLDGEMAIENSTNRELIASGSCRLTLRIHNFSIFDYGVYSCRCVNLYTLAEYESRDLIPDLPSNCTVFPSTNITVLPEGHPDHVEMHYIDTPMSIVNLTGCSGVGNSSGWTKVASGPLEGDVVVVANPADQGKFVCHDDEEEEVVYKIVYIAIEGYLPLRFFHPTHTEAVLPIPMNNLKKTICAVFTPFHGATTLDTYYYDNDGNETKFIPNNNLFIQYTPDPILDSVPDFLSHYENGVYLSRLIFNGDDEQVLERQFRCVASNQWESLSITFSLNSSYVAPSAPPITTEECLPQMTLLPSIAISSMHMTSSIVTSPDITTFRIQSQTETSVILPSTVISSMHTPSIAMSSSTSDIPTSQIPSSKTYTGTSVIQTSRTNSVLDTSSTVQPFPTTSATKPPRKLTNTTIAVIAAVLSTLVLILLILSICIIHRVHRRRHKARPAKARRLTEGELLVSRYPRRQLSLTLAQESPISMSPPLVTISHEGALVSRQMAKCIQELHCDLKQWLFPYEWLQFEEDLGSGAFGVVKKAKALSLQPGKESTTVAVKMLKDIASDEDEKDIISEMKVLQHVGAHPNVVSLLGASIHAGMLYVIVEYCAGGSLLSYLRSKRNDTHAPLSTRDLVGMASQVATGMKFLASRNCIHRDLAARNVLVTEDFVLKVADFGLARKMYESVYRPSGGKVPIKWMAPESVMDRINTSQSDVWSFGILLWEIMTLGHSPYPGKSLDMVLKDVVNNGYRMPKPPNCPQEMYEIMMQCWQLNPAKRPNFPELCFKLEELLQKGALSATHTQEYYNLSDDVVTEDSCISQSESGYYTRCIYCRNASDCDLCDECKQYIIESDSQSRKVIMASRLNSNDSGIPLSISEDHDEHCKYLHTYLQLLGTSKLSVGRDITQSMGSLCDCCKAKDRLHYDTLAGCVEARDVPYYNTVRKLPLPGNLNLNVTPHKLKVEALDSNDSGIRLMSVSSDCTSDVCSDHYKSCSQQLRLEENLIVPRGHQHSAHPRNRALFHELGIEESDV